MKKFFFVLTLTALWSVYCNGEIIADIRDPVLITKDLYWTSGDGLIDTSVNPVEEGWRAFQPGETFGSPTAGDRFYGVSFLFIPTEDIKGDSLGVWLGRLDGAVEIYLNGQLLKSYGTFPPDYFYRESVPKYCLLPEKFIYFGEENIISLRLFNDTGVYRLAETALGEYSQLEHRAGIFEVLNIHIFLVFANLCLIFGLYFLLIFFLRPNIRTNLFFGLANICIFIYFFEMGITFELFPFILFRVVAKSMLPLFFMVLTLFFMEYFRVLDRRAFKIGVVIAGLAAVAAFYIFGKTTADIDFVFNIAILIGAVELLFMAFASIVGLIRKNFHAIPICIGTFIGIGMGMHDIIVQISGRTPFIWLQGIGIQLFMISMFIALAIRSVRDQKNLEIYSSRIEKTTKSLERYIGRITGVSLAAASQGQELNSQIDRTVASIERLVDNSRMITNAADNQFTEVEQTKDGVHGLLNSIEVTNDKLKNQRKNVEETSATLEEMLENIQQVMEGLGKTRTFSEELGEKTAQGREAVASSTEAIEKIKTVSKGIYEMVEAVSDIAEQTSLLSINAAIEAAKAGSSGRGFAVVAGEIKKLAEGSAAKVNVITEQVDTIMERIEDGIRVNMSTGNVLEEINSSTDEVVTRVKHAHDFIMEQRYSSETLLQTVQELKQITNDIAKAADNQEQSSSTIRESLDTLTLSTEQVKSSISAMTRENAIIGEALSRISELSEKNARGIGDLEALLEEQD